MTKTFASCVATAARVSARQLAALLTIAVLAVAGPLGWVGTTLAQGGKGQPTPAAPVDPWPRQVKLGGATAIVYQPQVNSWQNNTLPGTTAFAAELPAGQASAVEIRRYVRAVLAAARTR